MADCLSNLKADGVEGLFEILHAAELFEVDQDVKVQGS